MTIEMYAMDVGLGMGVCGRIVADVRYLDGNPRRCEISWTDGTTSLVDGHDRLEADVDTPQRRARVALIETILRGGA